MEGLGRRRQRGRKGAVLFKRNKGAITPETEVGRKKKEGRMEGRESQGGGEKATWGISWPAAPSGTRLERHFYSHRKSESREQ